LAREKLAVRRGFELLLEILQTQLNQDDANSVESQGTEKWTRLEILNDLILVWSKLPDAIKETISVLIRQFVK
jgi:hypothetical protein